MKITRAIRWVALNDNVVWNVQVKVLNNSDRRVRAVLMGGGYMDSVQDLHDLRINLILNRNIKPGKTITGVFSTDVPTSFDFSYPVLKVLKVVFYDAPPWTPR